MLNKKRLLAAGIALAIGGMFGTGFARGDVKSDETLALRFCELAQRQANERADDARMRQAAALMAAAHRCDPDEPRYARLLADLAVLVHDRDMQLAAIKDFLMPGANPKNLRRDSIGQLEYATLVLDTKQTVSEKLEYLNGLLATPAILEDVRSALALQASALYEERKQPDKAEEMLNKALELNPLNFKALSIKYAALPATAKPDERVGWLLEMLKANPAQPVQICRVAEELANAGMVNDSANWYIFALDTVRAAQGLNVPAKEIWRPILLNIASELYLSDQLASSQDVLDQIISDDPENYPALVLRLLVEKRVGSKENADKLRVQARNTLINSLSAARAAIGVKDATVKPVNEGPIRTPELGDDLPLIRKVTDANQKSAYLGALADLAWFELYFCGRTEEAQKLLATYVAMADLNNPEFSVVAARLSGWIFMTDPKKMDEAKVKLSAVAERDLRAKLGLVVLASLTNPDQAKEDAEKLVSLQPSGVAGAMIWDNLRDKGIRIQPGPNGPALAAVLAKFPAAWMGIIKNPQQFYGLKGEPVQLTHDFAEPLMVHVQIHNKGTYPITIGEDGVIKPILWFDARLIGVVQQNMPAVCVDRITDTMVLKPNESIERTVRLDQGTFAQFLTANPTTVIALVPSVRTNVIGIPNGGVISSPGGYSNEFGKPMERKVFAINPANLQQLIQLAANGNGPQKICALQLLGNLGATFRGQNGNPQVQQQGDLMLEAIGKASHDNDQSVAAWATFLSVRFGAENQRETLVTQMLKDADWQSRLLGLVAAVSLPLEKQKSLVDEVLEAEKVEIVKDYAIASKKAMKNATTQPTTQPATQPIVKPAAK